MLGWEFPPYMSGGLGTACYGITRALAEKEVEVIFVLPRMGEKQSESTHHKVTLKEASGTKIHWNASYDMHSSYKQLFEQRYEYLTEQYEECHVPDSKVVKEVWEKYLRVHPVKSMLHAYATTQSYNQVQESYGKASYMYDPGADPMAFMQYMKGMVSEQTHTEIEQIIHKTSTHSHEGDTTLTLHGGYGKGLMDEVFRYSQSMLAFQSEEFDVIHAHEWMTCPAAIVLKHLTKKPLVLHIHALESDRSGSNLNPEVTTIERAGVEAADIIVAVSHYTKARIVELYGVNADKIRVVHNAVTQEESRANLNIPTHDENTKYVLFMGRITFQKGPEYFVEAAKLVLSRMPNVRFIMAGSGDMLSRMIHMVAQMRMGNRFHFTGFLRGEDVDRMYAMSDLYVMPSVSEPFGIAPLEAMSYDTPVLISRQSGVAEVVQNALKVDFWDVRDMANKICAVLTYPKLANEMITQCREELQHIRWENAAGKLINVYEHCLEKA